MSRVSINVSFDYLFDIQVIREQSASMQPNHQITLVIVHFMANLFPILPLLR